ncbi:MAG: diphosphomevalonate decarboxylase [Chloroflexi bacterium]|nr:diphosphomevalonate decarboxylase [Chloroflexota bacterium]MBI3340063.1 diphosphomevalonate decarboxylase [Chloroflexota bacterium]
MSTRTVTSVACANIAFIKYWGNRDESLRLPANGSISMNLDGLFTRTSVTFSASTQTDKLFLNKTSIHGPGLDRVSAMLDLVRGMAGTNQRAEVISENNFPSGAGIASSASAFAALALASSKAAGLDLSERDLSRLARRGSGSASRSIPAGFVEWQAGTDDEDSFAVSIAPPAHWQLADCIAIVSSVHKKTGSTEGHAIAKTSPLQNARVADAPRRLDLCRRAILDRDFDALAAIVELDSDMMHAVMMTSSPALHYWQPASLAVMKAVQQWREEGSPVCYTVDAGANIHVICLEKEAEQIALRLRKIAGVKDVLTARPGGSAKVIEQKQIVE